MVLVLSDGARLEMRSVRISDKPGAILGAHGCALIRTCRQGGRRIRRLNQLFVHWHHNVTNYGFFNVIGYISDNLLIPILDFFYGLVPGYGLAIVALTIVIRVALYPLSAGSIRSARRMRIAQPVIQKRQAEIKSATPTTCRSSRKNSRYEGVRQSPGRMSAIAGADANPVCPVRHAARITVRRRSMHDQSQGSARRSDRG